HPKAQLPAGEPRGGDLQEGSPGSDLLADQQVVEVDAGGRQVLAERPGRERLPELLAPPGVVLGGIRIHSFGRPAVDRVIRLLILVIVAGPAPPDGANVGSPRDMPAGPVAASAEASGRIGSIVAGCVVPAPVLLAIGKVESNLASTPVIGPALNGSLPGTVVVRDTDGGSLDGDPVWDHPVGPMQILPSMWRRWGRDADGDGV